MATTIDQIKKRIGQINSIAFINRSTSEVITFLKAISAPNYDFAHTASQYRGANSVYPYACDITMSNSALTFTTKEFPPDLLNLINRTTATEGTAEASGDVGDITNVTGTSVSSATAGIASIAETSGANMKEGTFLIKAVTATTVDFYAYHDADDINMTSEETGKINATPYTIPAEGSTVDIDELGITVTGGSAVSIAMTEDDTATVTLRKDNLGYITSDIGGDITGNYLKVVLSHVLQTGGTATQMTLYKVLVQRGAIDNPDGESATMSITLNPVKDPDNSNKVGQMQWTVGANA